jgi:hypothetical protein
MKKFIVTAAIAVLAMTLSPAMAGVWWLPDAPGATYQQWHFTPDFVASSGAGYTADPEVANNPDENGIVATISPTYGGTIDYDDQTGFWGSPAIHVALEIPNFEDLNLYKEIWVDLGEGVTASGIVVSAHDGGSVTFVSEILPGEGIWEFGVLIRPNPEYEKINFYVQSATGVNEVYLDYISVATICIPEPATLVLLGLGAILLRKRM